MTELYVIRHGETELNARRVVQPAGTPLSSRGISQARLLARRLARVGITRIVASDLARATMTAEALQESTGAPIELDPLLQERNFGNVRGTPYDDLGFDLFAADYHPPEGESWSEFETRVDRAFVRIEALAVRTEGALAVVTHGLVCRSIASRHLAAGESEGPPQRWGNTSLTIAEGPRPWRVRLLNCTRHLEGATADDPAAPSGL
jgi:probable phosphoglycerate mutase